MIFGITFSMHIQSNFLNPECFCNHYETATLENIMLVPGERIHKELEDILVFLERLQEEIHGL